MSTSSPNPKSCLKRSSSAGSNAAPHAERSHVQPLSLDASREPHRVTFPPSPKLTRTFSVYSSSTYDRSPIVVLPNTCALPARGCPGRTYHSTTSGVAPKPAKLCHPSRLPSSSSAQESQALSANAVPALVHDTTSESDESDGVSSPPPPMAAFATPSLQLPELSLSFLPHAYTAPSLYRAPGKDDGTPNYDEYEGEKNDKDRYRRGRRDRPRQDRRSSVARHRQRAGTRNGDEMEEEDETEDPADDDDIASGKGCLESFSNDLALSLNDDDEGCLGGF